MAILSEHPFNILYSDLFEPRKAGRRFFSIRRKSILSNGLQRKFFNLMLFRTQRKTPQETAQVLFWIELVPFLIVLRVPRRRGRRNPLRSSALAGGAAAAFDAPRAATSAARCSAGNAARAASGCPRPSAAEVAAGRAEGGMPFPGPVGFVQAVGDGGDAKGLLGQRPGSSGTRGRGTASRGEAEGRAPPLPMPSGPCTRTRCRRLRSLPRQPVAGQSLPFALSSGHGGDDGGAIPRLRGACGGVQKCGQGLGLRRRHRGQEA
jgi:hypothetical protein